METVIRILLIEDDEDDFLLFRDYVSEMRDYKVELTWISEYGEALDTMQLNRHDLCFLDYRLGEHTGLELLREAKARNANGPFLFLTGQGSREIDLEAMNEGVADYLVKSELNSYLLERSIRYTLELKKNEEIRVERERLNGVIEMSGAAAHELNQPLQAISGYTEILLGQVDDSKRDELLQKMIAEIRRMGTITGKLNRITRYKTMQYTSDSKIIDIDEASKND